MSTPRDDGIKVHLRSYELRVCRDEDLESAPFYLFSLTSNFYSTLSLHIYGLSVRRRAVGEAGSGSSAPLYRTTYTR